MAGTASEESGVGRSLEGISSGQRCQSSEALAEWRSSDQVENGTPSTSPPYWDTDDDDDCGPKPSELYGKYTWKIDKFSQINKRELRSNAFEVGGYKWYILIYPQGCDVCNHLSLFLCVANHDKLLPGWSHFAQFTIAVVNKDPKKSKYSDTLHRFWKKEHDWGWKKFMELSKVIDGFIDGDNLIIKLKSKLSGMPHGIYSNAESAFNNMPHANLYSMFQLAIYIMKERADRPFKCLDCQYRRELVRVYLTNVEQACRRFVEDSRSKLGKLIEDKSRWSSFCGFWLGIDQNARRRMSREKTDSILKAVVKKFFIEKEVTSTLVMDSLYSGLKALEGQIKSKKVAKGKYLDAEEVPIPIVRLEKDTFVLVDDVLLLLERAAMEPLPPKDEKGPQNRTKDGGSGEDFTKDSIERDERRLTELGRRTIEIFVLAHIFSSKIEVSYQEAVALKRQEELIREEEAAWLAECDQKAKRGALEKEKKAKKKQGKQKRNNRKGKDKSKDEKSGVTVADKTDQESATDGRKEMLTEDTNEKPDTLEDVSDVSDSVDCVPEILQPDSEETDSTRFVNWDTDASEVQPPMEPSGSGLSSVQNGERKSPSLMDDSSSTCSTDSLPSVVMNGPYKGTLLPNQKAKKSPSRGRTQRGRAVSDVPELTSDGHRLLPSETLTDVRAQANDVSGSSCKVTESESEAAVLNILQDQIKRLEQDVVKKEEEVVSLQRKLTVKDEVDMDRPKKETTAEVPESPRSPPIYPPSVIRPKPEVKKPSLGCPQQTDKVIYSAETAITSKPNTNKTTSPKPIEKQATQQAPISTEKPITQKVVPVSTEKPTAQQAPAMSRPLSAPLTPGPRPAAATPVVSMVQTAPLLSRSVSAAGRLGPDPSPATHSYIPQSYRNAMMGNHIPSTSASFTQPHSPNSIAVSSSSHTYSQAPPVMMSSNLFLPQGSEKMDQNPPSRPSLSFGMLNRSMINDFQNIDLYNQRHHPVHRSQDRFVPEFPASVSGRLPHGGVIADEFPHLDIINDLLDEEQGIGSYPSPAGFQSFTNGPHHLHRQFTFPGDVGMLSEVGPSTSSCGFERRGSLDEFQHGYNQYDIVRDMASQGNLMPYANGHIPNEWQMGGSDLSYLGLRNNTENDGYPYHHIHEYPNLSQGVNGYTVFRPSNGH